IAAKEGDAMPRKEDDTARTELGRVRWELAKLCGRLNELAHKGRYGAAGLETLLQGMRLLEGLGHALANVEHGYSVPAQDKLAAVLRRAATQVSGVIRSPSFLPP